MPITDLHNEYEDYSIQWKRIRDCVAGEDALRTVGKYTYQNRIICYQTNTLII